LEDAMSACAWTYNGLPCELKVNTSPSALIGASGVWHCGYVTLPRPVDDQGYDGLAAGVDVHGGITYASEDGDGYRYGFDTAHYDSGPVANDEAWCRAETERMADQLLALLAGVLG
jgi:hypothetical protein